MKDVMDKTAAEADFIIVGGGSAGCVLANRLSANPAHRVLLIEAGSEDNSLMVSMPKGFGKLLFDTRHVRRFATEPEAGSGGQSESWPRGMMLGGSSAVNGMFYTRGQPRDYDDWAAQGASGWSWADIGRCFKQMEDHTLGEDELRGAGGPLHVSTHPNPHPLCEAVIEAGVQSGLQRKDDINRIDQEGIGYITSTIKDGRRVSAASAFLEPIRRRPNLRICSGTLVEKINFDGSRAVGLTCSSGGRRWEVRAAREVIVCAGTLQSPQLLQLSGIGAAGHLRSLGLAVISDVPGVGQNLREHRMLFVQRRIRQPLSLNREFSGARLGLNVAKYLLSRKGLMATGSHDVVAFVKTSPELDRPDAEVVMAPFSLKPGALSMAFEKEHGIQFFGYQLRPESQGSVLIKSADPLVAPEIRPNYLSAEADRRAGAAILRYIRELCGKPAMRPYLLEETAPGPSVQTDAEVLDYHQHFGSAVYHTAGTCKMGNDPLAVVDARLRVRGVQGLRVADCSVMPTLVSAHTNGPVMAMAWRAAELILEDAA